jgi:phosphoserine phosphatase
MSHFLSLIAAKAKAPLTAADADRARQALAMAGAESDAPAWLSPGEACDIPFDGARESPLEAARSALSDRPVDVNVVPAVSRRKRLLVADMDSTLIEQECIDEMAAEIGAKPAVAAITERAMRGEIAFEPALRERVALFAGLRADIAMRVLAERITITPGAAVLVATMRAAGAHTALVSGGFTVFAEPIGRRLGFDEQRANKLLIQDGAFTGLVAEPVLGRAAKVDALLEMTRRLGIGIADAVAVGDGANDLDMIKLAGLGVAFHGKPALHAAADAAIDHADLTGLLFLQGYRRDEFVEAE